MGGQEDERDAAVWSLQPLPDHTGVMITGVVGDDVDPPLAGVAGLQLREQRDGGGGDMVEAASIRSASTRGPWKFCGNSPG